MARVIQPRPGETCSHGHDEWHETQGNKDGRTYWYCGPCNRKASAEHKKMRMKLKAAGNKTAAERRSQRSKNARKTAAKKKGMTA